MARTACRATSARRLIDRVLCVTLARTVAPEVLDNLAADDPAARRSRRDLRRVHRFMGTRGIVLKALRALPVRQSRARPLQVLELGAGDGSLMLGVARALAGEWPAVELTLLDRQDLLRPSAVGDYAAAGWTVTQHTADVLDWSAGDGVAWPRPQSMQRWDLIAANLFLHHFQAPQLATLLAAVAARTENFFACEPRRAWPAFVGSHLIGAIGANAVTREDAVLSVRAGFRGTELQSFWPAGGTGWTLAEYPAGLFSHCLAAARAPVKPTRAK